MGNVDRAEKRWMPGTQMDNKTGAGRERERERDGKMRLEI